jgi:hypothetical protein
LARWRKIFRILSYSGDRRFLLCETIVDGIRACPESIEVANGAELEVIEQFTLVSLSKHSESFFNSLFWRGKGHLYLVCYHNRHLSLVVAPAERYVLRQPSPSDRRDSAVR